MYPLIIWLPILYCIPGLEKLTNANRSSSVNDRLFPVELTDIADVTFEFRKSLEGLSAGILVHIPLYCRFPVY